MIINWSEITAALATHWRIVHRGSQIWWVVPHALCDSWVVMSPGRPRPMYAHEGD